MLRATVRAVPLGPEGQGQGVGLEDHPGLPGCHPHLPEVPSQGPGEGWLMLGLRPYQARAIEAIIEADRQGVKRPLVVHPTGTGKTVTFCHLLKNRSALGRALVLVHRDELAQQTVEKIGMVAPELAVGVVKAERDDVSADVVVASVQTASRDRRLARLIESARNSPFETVVVD